MAWRRRLPARAARLRHRSGGAPRLADADRPERRSDREPSETE